MDGIYTTTNSRGKTVVLDFREKHNIVIIKRLYNIRSQADIPRPNPVSSSVRQLVRGPKGRPTEQIITTEEPRTAYDDSVIEQSEYTIKKGIVTILAPKFFSYTRPLELSIRADTLTAADGLQFVRDASGRTYSPAEIADLKMKADAEAFIQKSKAEEAKEKAEQARAEALQKSIAAEQELKKVELELATKVKLAELEKIDQDKQLLAQRLAAMEQVRRETEDAINSLPVVANKTISFDSLDGVRFTNITLTKATLDGIIYTEGAGGGTLSLSRIPVQTLASMGYNTNYIRIYVAMEKENQQQRQSRLEPIPPAVLFCFS